jgi:hypothetical protein
MNKVTIKLDDAGIREMLKSEGIVRICEAQANRIAAAAGDEYVAERRSYPERGGAAVRPDTPKAYFENLENNTLLKAMGGGGGS